MIKGKIPGGGGVVSLPREWLDIRLTLSFRVIEWVLQYDQVSSKSEIACVTPAWSSHGYSLNYIGISKDMGKRLPQLYHIKMKISYDLGFIAIRVAMAT